MDTASVVIPKVFPSYGSDNDIEDFSQALSKTRPPLLGGRSSAHFVPATDLWVPLYFKAVHTPLFSAWLFVIVLSGFLPSNSNFEIALHPHRTSFSTVAQESVIVIFVPSRSRLVSLPPTIINGIVFHPAISKAMDALLKSVYHTLHIRVKLCISLVC